MSAFIVFFTDSQLLLTFNYRSLTINPGIPVVRAEFPGGHIVFYIAKHHIPFLGGIAVFHYKVAAQLHDYGKRVNGHGAGFHASLAGGAGAQFLNGYIVIEQRFAVILKFFIGIDVFAYFL